MLVTFTCKAHEDITMFGDVAKRLLKMMGHSGTIPSALTADQVPLALTRLREAIDNTEKRENELQTPAMEDEGDQEVSIAHRAIPLIGLLENANKAKCNVMWREH